MVLAFESEKKAMRTGKILVTGAAGFIGSNLCQRLLSEGHNVIGLDNLSTGYKENISHLLHLKNFEFIEGDITAAFKGNVFQIYNLAAPSSATNHLADPIGTIKTVILGTLNMLELAKSCNATILQASTSKIYGKTHTSSIPETTPGVVDMLSQSAAYIESKRVSETIMTSFWRKYGTDIRIARIFNTYGPNMWADNNRIIPMVIERALQGRDITIYQNGLQYRSPCYIDDVVDGLIQLMNNHLDKSQDNHEMGVCDSNYNMHYPQKQKKSKDYQQLHRPINIGNNQRLTIKDLVEKIIKLSGSKSQVKYMNLSQGELGNCTPDITLANKLLDWQPHVDLDVGLIKTIKYFEHKLLSTQQGFRCLSWVEMA